MNDCVFIYKFGNMFYVEGNEAIVIHFILNYKINNNKVYFNNLNKVIKTLNDKKINYKCNNKFVKFKNNNYNFYYSNGENKIKLYYLTKDLKIKINSLSVEDKIKLFNKIEKFANER